jgi:teichuronic acid biosynthesis glycosyltransferase TuaG
MFFSIVIPLYNSENYIEETLLSLVNQSYKNFEVIIVDDKSTDDSLLVIASFVKKYPELVVRVFTERPSQFPKGVSGARNYGINQAQGEWVCFLDSDDLFVTDKLEKTYTSITMNQNCLVFFHGMAVFDDEKKVITQNQVDTFEKEVDIKEKLFDNNIICTSTVTIKRDYINQIGGFSLKVNGVEDYYCWLEASIGSNWYYIKQPLTIYRVREGSLMRKRPLTHYIDQTYALLNLVKSNNKFSKEQVKRIDNYMFTNLCIFYTNHSVRSYGLSRTIASLTPLAYKGHFNYFAKTTYRLIRIAFLKHISSLK